jgi:transglutaminase-like putative cysteine protease
VGEALTLLALIAAVIPVGAAAQETYHGRYWYVLDNINVTQADSAEVLLWLAVPADHRGQKARVPAISPAPTEMFRDSLTGTEVAFWRITDFQDRDRMLFYYDFEVEAEPVLNSYDPARIAAYDTTSAEYRRFTQSEPWIELTPQVRAKAAELTLGAQDSWEKARRLFTWTIENMTYEYPDMQSRGAAKSFPRLKGDCGEFTSVFCALCRAAGIPARPVICVWPSGSGHEWAEFLIPGYGWLPADASVAELLRPGSKTLASEEAVQAFMKGRQIPVRDPQWLFGNLYPYRIIVFTGSNIELASKQTGITRTFRFLQPGGQASYPPSVEIRGLSGKTVHGGFYMFGEDRTSPEAAMAQAETELASSYDDAGLADRAEAGYRKQLASKPEDGITWFRLGQLLRRQKHYEGAVAAFNQSLAGKAGSLKSVVDAASHYLLGTCFDLLGQRERALAEYQWVMDSGVDYQGMPAEATKHIEAPFSEEDLAREETGE